VNEYLGIAIGIILTFGTGVAVASEFALLNLDRHELESRQQRGEKHLGIPIRALKTTSTQLSSSQLGITLTTLLAGYTFEPAISSLLRGPLTAVGLPDGVVLVLGPVLAIVVATLFSMIFGELVPKNFALAIPRQTAKLIVPLQFTFTTILKPLIRGLNGTADAVIRRLGVEPKEELSGARTADELSYLIRHSATAGLLDDDDAVLLRRTLRFAELEGRDVMTPRVRVDSVGVDDTAADVIARALATGRSRFPVIDGTPDEIVGFVHVAQAFGVPLDAHATTTAGSLATPALRVPESMHADAILTELRASGEFIAVVGDEHGGTAGIVTLEDLVEEIVGELEDEHDRARAGLTRRGRSVTFDASWRPDELLDRAGVVIPDDDAYETAAGFVTERLERQAELGDEVELGDGSGPDGGVLRVERMDGHRIVRLRWIPAVDEAARDAGEPTDHDRAVAHLKGDGR
jgi:CBS domain containing-hemolysin-like protein